MKPIVIAIVVGEASGDILGSALIASLKKRYPNASFCGIGGPRMLAEGFESFFPQERLAVMGLIEPLKRLPELLHIRKSIIERFLSDKPNVFIGVDAPDFNLKIEAKLRQEGIKTVHYVSPSVWAWRSGRIKKIKKSIDLMLTLFPFETKIYENSNIPVKFIGHHLADKIPMEIDVDAARAALNLVGAGKVVALLPGSRQDEVKRLAPVFFEVASQCLQDIPDTQFIVPAATKKLFIILQQNLEEYRHLPIRLIEGNSAQVMAAADVVLMASGTTTLEAMLLKKPMVVAYKMSWLSYAILSRLVKIPYVSLPNLLAGKSLVPEFLQSQATVENISAALISLLKDTDKTCILKETFLGLHRTLRRGASDQAAMAIEALIEKNTEVKN